MGYTADDDIVQDDQAPPWLSKPERLDEWEAMGMIVVKWPNVIRRVMMLPAEVSFSREFPEALRRLGTKDGPMRAQEADETIGQYLRRCQDAHQIVDHMVNQQNRYVAIGNPGGGRPHVNHA